MPRKIRKKQDEAQGVKSYEEQVFADALLEKAAMDIILDSEKEQEIVTLRNEVRHYKSELHTLQKMLIKYRVTQDIDHIHNALLLVPRGR